MKVFFVALMVGYLVVTKSMASCAYGKSKNKAEVDDALGLGVNNTGPEQQSESRSRRTLADSDDDCYTQYFVENMPPTGFESVHDSVYICQNIIEDKPQKTFYSTMFDENLGIAVYAGYLVKKEEAESKTKFPRISKWFQDPGIGLQGNNKMYKNNGQNIEKGHLVPAAIYSFDCMNLVSTFTYTNAVPQYQGFNTGSWKTYEGQVRTSAEQCANSNGDLYLLTGISEVKINKNGKEIKAAMKYFHPSNKYTGEKIAIPNSMWTAGCCIRNGKVRSRFAAIGNNVDDKDSPMHEVTVDILQKILAKGAGVKEIKLFPGNKRC